MPQERFIWIPHSKLCFIPAKVKTADVYSTLVTLNDGTEMRISGNVSKYDDVTRAVLVTNFEDIADPNSGAVVGDGSIMYQIQTRFSKGFIFTNVGRHLIAVNPYTQSPLYSSQYLDTILAAAKAQSDSQSHIYSLVVSSFFNILSMTRNQSILLQGIPGSGKSTMAKNALACCLYAATAHSNSARESMRSRTEDMHIILEALGNAKTALNTDSSRCGKCIEVYCDSALRYQSSRIITYGIETSRVVSLKRGERSFHIFYMLIAGATAQVIYF